MYGRQVACNNIVSYCIVQIVPKKSPEMAAIPDIDLYVHVFLLTIFVVVLFYSDAKSSAKVFFLKKNED